MWLVCCEKLMTNAESVQRHFSSDSSCPACRHGVEDIHHVLHSCYAAHAIWSSLIKRLGGSVFHVNRCDNSVADGLVKLADMNSADVTFFA
ncbi:hypothetical protein V6N11_018038 [Hibiscus sabdariffa]|uniref:Reverse transcriptase zinc-binding domain-containing protein n=1 Tax=Hibiscus sabdariffa TaxID=183260 RepID=A0ABR2T676_9ROSI